MSKQLIKQFSSNDPNTLPSKVFIANLKGKKGDPGEIDNAMVAEIIEEYLDANPVGLYMEEFPQSFPAAVWVITHSLPFKPSVTIVDSAGTRVQTEIIYDSPTQIRSIASAAFSGRAYLS